MRVKQVTVYQYDELGEEAQKIARQWFREASAGDVFRFEHITDNDAPEIAEHLGITLATRHRRAGLAIYWSGFSSQGDGASFEGSWRADAVDGPALKAYALQDKELHRIADELAAIAKEYPQASASISTSGYYSHSGTMHVESESNIDSDEPDAQRREEEFINAADDIEQLMRDFADWIYKQLEAAYDYDNSDEVVGENIRANGHEFLEDGTPGVD